MGPSHQPWEPYLPWRCCKCEANIVLYLQSVCTALNIRFQSCTLLIFASQITRSRMNTFWGQPTYSTNTSDARVPNLRISLLVDHSCPIIGCTDVCLIQPLHMPYFLLHRSKFHIFSRVTSLYCKAIMGCVKPQPMLPCTYKRVNTEQIFFQIIHQSFYQLQLIKFKKISTQQQTE